MSSTMDSPESGSKPPSENASSEGLDSCVVEVDAIQLEENLLSGEHNGDDIENLNEDELLGSEISGLGEQTDTSPKEETSQKNENLSCDTSSLNDVTSTPVALGVTEAGDVDKGVDPSVGLSETKEESSVSSDLKIQGDEKAAESKNASSKKEEEVVEQSNDNDKSALDKIVEASDLDKGMDPSVGLSETQQESSVSNDFKIHEDEKETECKNASSEKEQEILTQSNDSEKSVLDEIVDQNSGSNIPNTDEVPSGEPSDVVTLSESDSRPINTEHTDSTVETNSIINAVVDETLNEDEMEIDSVPVQSPKGHNGTEISIINTEKAVVDETLNEDGRDVDSVSVPSPKGQSGTEISGSSVDDIGLAHENYGENKGVESLSTEASEHVECTDEEKSQTRDEDDDNLLGSLSQQNNADQLNTETADEGDDPLMNSESLVAEAVMESEDQKDDDCCVAEDVLPSEENDKISNQDNDKGVEIMEEISTDDKEKESSKNVDVSIERNASVAQDKEDAGKTLTKDDTAGKLEGSDKISAERAEDVEMTEEISTDAKEKETNDLESVDVLVELNASIAGDGIDTTLTKDDTAGTDVNTSEQVDKSLLEQGEQLLGTPVDTDSVIQVEQVHSEYDGEPSEEVEITGEIRSAGGISVIQNLFEPKPEAGDDDMAVEEVGAVAGKKTVRGKRPLVILHSGKVVEGLSEQKEEICASCKVNKSVLYKVSSGSDKSSICSQICFLNYEKTNTDCRIVKVNFDSIDKEPLPDLSSDWSGIRHYASKCSHCHTDIKPNMNSLSWETMEFCSVNCVNEYQKALGSSCVVCSSSVRPSYLGKYCVRFGRELKQFCSNTCLEKYKPDVKICAYCQRNIAKISGSSCLAQVGETGCFKDFCSIVCIVKYDDLLNLENLGIADCTVCNKNSQIRAKINFEDKMVVLCSDPCISAFKFVNQIKAENCDTCSKLIDKEKDKPFSIMHYSGSKKMRLFCSQGCLNRFVTHNRQIVPCVWCRVKKYNFDLIRNEDSLGRFFFCSVVCLTQHATARLRRRLCTMCPNQAEPKFQVSRVDGFDPLCSSLVCREKLKERNRANPVIATVASLRVAPPQVLSAEPTAVTPSVVAPSTTVITLPPPIPQPLPPIPPPVQIPEKVPVEISQRVIFRQAPPPLMANKSVGCSPKMVSKGQNFRTPSSDVATQSDIPEKVVYVPIPVPIYVPAPMMMYSAPFPIPLPMPLPVPVPIFLPVPKKTHEEVQEFVQKVIKEIPNNPVEADLLAMAAMLAEEAAQEEKENQSDKPLENGTNSNHGLSNGKSSLDEDLLQVLASADIDPSELVGTSVDKTEGDLDLSESQEEDSCLGPRLRRKRGRTSTSSSKSKKKKKEKEVEEEEARKQPSSLKPEYGLNAWRKWVMQKNNEIERSVSPGRRGPKPFKTDLLKMTPEEVCASLCFFVKEITKPDGDRYAPDSIYYLCLGIQQYLYESARVDNIFADFHYERFSIHLDEVISEYVSARGDEAYLTSRIEEEHLWECRQLGAHSPQVLLYTLLYFNTKYFGLKTVADHHSLSFVSIVKSWRRVQSGMLEGAKGSQITRLVTLKHVIPAKKKGDTPITREMLENWENPLRCPVKLYEFYISKCPESVRNRNDLYYITPERSCVPDSPVWYSTRQVTDEVLQRMINRTLLVRDVDESLVTFDNLN